MCDPLLLLLLQERLAAEVLQRLEAAGLAGAFAAQEMPLVPVLAHLECTGMLFDVVAAQRHRSEIVHAMELLQREAAALLGSSAAAVNLGSATQVARLLFDELGLSPAARKRTSSGARLSASKVSSEPACCGTLTTFRRRCRNCGTSIRCRGWCCAFASCRSCPRPGWTVWPRRC